MLAVAAVPRTLELAAQRKQTASSSLVRAAVAVVVVVNLRTASLVAPVGMVMEMEQMARMLLRPAV